jgi:hypothetical protein
VVTRRTLAGRTQWCITGPCATTAKMFATGEKMYATGAKM